ncbi:DUF4232 domain-containing protein [Plantibacter sp. YIM 135347]|uniref:DUF4232 domain-containing protein n=1 Tax=Plantibacter sp. YIM 135347 TaxID=3423919 RepID=UPI003D356EF1
MRRRRVSALILPMIVGALLLAGCASGSGTGAGSVTPSASTSVSTTPTPTATPTGSAGGGADPNAPAGQCADSALAVTVTEFDAGAGNISYDVAFTNTATSACVLRGTPGVSVVGDGNGTELGKPARQDSAAEPEDVNIAPGAAAHAVLRAVNIGTDGGPLSDCAPVAGDGYRIYSPHSFTAVFVASPGVPACTSDDLWMSIGSVQTQGF